jgi:hypothetical protein
LEGRVLTVGRRYVGGRRRWRWWWRQVNDTGWKVWKRRIMVGWRVVVKVTGSSSHHLALCLVSLGSACAHLFMLCASHPSAICDFPRENEELQLEQELSRQSDSKIGAT